MDPKPARASPLVISGIALGALVIGFVSAFLLTRSNSCLDWQNRYLDSVSDAVDGDAGGSGSTPDEKLIQERPEDCPFPFAEPSELPGGTASPTSGETVVVEGVPLPRVMPFVAISQVPEVSFAGYTTELVEIGGSLQYEAKVDVTWQGPGPPRDLDCSIGFIDTIGVPIVNFDDGISFTSDYLDDLSVGKPLSWVMLHFKSKGPPSAMRLDCS